MAAVGLLVGPAVTAAASTPAATPATAPTPNPVAAPNPVDAQRALSTYQALQQNLYVPQYKLYASSDPREPFGYLWDFVNGFAATNYVAAMPGMGGRLESDLQARDQGLSDYYNTNERTPSGQPQPPAYASGVVPPLGPPQPTYYDDNAWVALDLLKQYSIDHKVPELARAEEIFHFVVSGWDANSADPCPGGVYWEDVAGSARNTVSNAPNAEAGLLIYQATKDPYYLHWATRMYDWVRSCLLSPNGMYYDHVNPNGSVNTALWSYNQGTMVGAGTLLFQATGDRTYLQQAEQTASASVAYYGNGGRLYQQPDVFNAILFRNLFQLAAIDHNPAYRQMAASYADRAWVQDRRSNGLFNDPDPGGGESPVNQTAPMAEIYALLADRPPVFAATGSTTPGTLQLQPGASGTLTLALQSDTAVPQTVSWSATPPAGGAITPPSGTVSVPAGGTAATPVTVTAGTTDGRFQFSFDLTSTAGTVQPVSASVIVARPGDLGPFLNDPGISSDTDQAAGNYDGLGFSYSEQALTAAGLAPGATVSIGGLQYRWPEVAAGQPDCVTAAGQTIPLAAVAGATQLGVMGSATNGPSTGPMTITYTDGTTQTVSLGLSDWTLGGGGLAYGNGVAAATPYRNSQSGSSQRLGTYVFTAVFPVQAGRTVASVTLPARANQGELHLFAVGSDKGPLTTAP